MYVLASTCIYMYMYVYTYLQQGFAVEQVLAEGAVDTPQARAALSPLPPSVPRARTHTAGARALLVATAAARRKYLVRRLAVEARLRVVVAVLGGVARQLARGMGFGHRTRQSGSDPRLATTVRASAARGRVWMTPSKIENTVYYIIIIPLYMYLSVMVNHNP